MNVVLAAWIRVKKPKPSLTASRKTTKVSRVKLLMAIVARIMSGVKVRGSWK